MKKTFYAVPALALTGAALASVGSPAFAVGNSVDYSTLTGAIDVSSTITAILAVGALVIGISLAVMGVRKVISMVRGA
jgi:hypothetical protein